MHLAWIFEVPSYANPLTCKVSSFRFCFLLIPDKCLSINLKLLERLCNISKGEWLIAHCVNSTVFIIAHFTLILVKKQWITIVGIRIKGSLMKTMFKLTRTIKKSQMPTSPVILSKRVCMPGIACGIMFKMRAPHIRVALLKSGLLIPAFCSCAHWEATNDVPEIWVSTSHIRDPD